MVLDDFFTQVAEAPNAVAVQDGDRRLTYRELAGHAGRLAGRLTERGVTTDSVVAVYADRSAELVVGELAAWLAGAAYLPLDPAHPVARTRELLALSGAAAVISTAEGATLTDDVLVVDLTGQPPREPSPAPPPPDGATLAYIIYTSGSTGRPKGVAVTHASLTNLLAWHVRSYHLGRQDRTTLLVGPGFDISVWDTWPTLAAGGTLVVPSAEVRTSPADLVTWLAEERITRTFLPTPLAEAVLTQPWPADTTLRVLHAGGSAMQRGVPVGLPFTVVNLYGPAECTVGVTTGEVVPGGPVPPPIGVPVDGVRCYVLDGLDPVPDGEAGEMCLAGACVARGYLGDPATTAASFVPDLYAPGQRMYRTGDKVRRRPDGVFEYIGRYDDQAKIRGFRIEPGEVAATLKQHPAVGDAFVVAERSGHADARLVGYVTGDASVAELLAFASARLPGYMVPAAIVGLAALPMTPNGKVDRAALPSPDRAAAGLSGTAAPHRTRTEAALGTVMAGLLGIDEVGADDNFFALGGTSLLIGRLAAAIAAEFGVAVSIRELFDVRSVTGIAALIDERTSGQPGMRPGTQAPVRPSIPLAHRDRPIPLSLPQERVWFFERLSPGNLAYNFQATVALHGPVDVEVLRAALAEIVRRHEILRTAFVAVDGVAQQRPMAKVTVPLRVLDIPAEHADKAVAAELAKPFDLTRPPLARWLLLRHGAHDHTLVHVEHHFVHDGWSLAVFLSELAALYPAFADGKPSPLPELAVQYADFACWQREWMRGEVLRAHVAHWTARLSGAPDVLELPADHPRPPVMNFRGAAPRIQVPVELSRALRAFSREHQVSLFTTMYAGFAALLHHYTGQRDMLVGTGAANRTMPEVEPLLGMLVNTLVLRTQLTPDLPFTDLLDQVRRTVAEMLAWSDTPVDAVIDALGPARDPSRTPLFQVMFSFHDSAVPDLDFGGLTGRVTVRSNNTAKSDLNVIVIPRGEQRLGRTPRPEDDELTMIWEHSTELFDEATVSRMVTHYLSLLADAVTRPATPVRALRLDSAADRARLTRWGRGPRTSLVARPVTELVAEQARRAPEAIAISEPETSVTYRELEERSGRVAARLAELVTGREPVVAVHASRGAHLVVGQLAALKAGAGYLPLDPDTPARRLGELLTESGAAALLTVGPPTGEPPPFDGPVLRLDQLDDLPEPLTPVAVRPENLAYVIYTSGSTGKPKGVQATHGGLANLVGWCRETYQLRPSDRSTLIASPAFDASVWETWSTLTSGGTLVVPPEQVRAVPRELTAWLLAQRITWSFLPTPLAEAVLDEPWPTEAALRLLLTGGDALRRPVPEDLPFVLVNHYGPTETTVVATATEVPPGGPDAAPIGRPIGDVRVHVLAGLDPVPVGVPGELCVGGAGVTRGYLGNPADTAAAFVPDPAEPGQRMYRTGDRVRWLVDGQLEFLGRIDEQVKIRGFRVEPGEIAATLRRHPSVEDAVVLARPDSTGRLRLIGYAATAASAEDLNVFLAQRLPAYLVPDRLIPMAELPRNTGGKVDRAALPEPASEAPVVPTSTETERRVAALWQELLGVEAVGADDDFFGLGGYSLLVAKMLAMAEEEFGRAVPLSVFLTRPTVADLATAIDARGTAAPPPPATATGIDVDTLSDAEAAALLTVLTGEDS